MYKVRHDREIWNKLCIIVKYHDWISKVLFLGKVIKACKSSMTYTP